MRRQLAIGALGLLVCLAGCSGHHGAPTAPETAVIPAAGTAAAIHLTLTPATLPIGGGSIDIRVETLANETGTVPAGHVPVTLSASGGQLSTTDIATDGTGHGVATWSGTSGATITARAGDVVGSAAVLVATPQPAPPNGSVPSPPISPPPNTPRLIVDVRASPRVTDAVTPVTFSATARSSDNRPTGALTYAWDFNEDGVPDSTDATPIHLFTPRDHWTVRLQVTAANGLSGTGSIEVIVSATPGPAVHVALTGTPSAALTGQTFTFTATAVPNSTAGGPVITYDWDFDTSTPSVDLTTTVGTATTSYPTTGTRTVRVTARTATGTSGTATTSVTVSPALAVDIAVLGANPAPNAPRNFTATATGLGSDAALNFAWDFGDGHTVTETSAFEDQQPHTYVAAGTYTVSVTVTALDGHTATKSISVTIP